MYSLLSLKCITPTTSRSVCDISIPASSLASRIIAVFKILPALDVSGNHAVVAVFVSRVAPLEEKDSVVLNEEKVYGYRS